MAKPPKKPEEKLQENDQPSLFDTSIYANPISSQVPLETQSNLKFGTKNASKKLKLDFNKSANLNSDVGKTLEGIPRLVLPTRWEYLQPEIEGKKVSLRTIIRPVHQGMNVIEDIVEYLRTTGGCQVLVIRADTGSGKTTFLNTLPHYMQDIGFHTQTLDLQPLSEDEFGAELRKIHVSSAKINLIILEGREKPLDISDKYIQVVLANINRFARSKRVPLLFVIPTIEEQVARNWCDHGTRIGDLIPEQKLYEGSRWYNFPGVSRDKYIEIAEETVRTLNPPNILFDFGVSPEEVKGWVANAPTIGRFIEILANRISDRRRVTKITSKGKKEHVWIVYCSPDNRHYDHTYLVIDGLCQDEKLKVSPTKLIPPNSDTPLLKDWLQPAKWTKLVATRNYLDIRLINFPIITVVTSALVYGDEDLLQSFKDARLNDYREQIPEEMRIGSVDWEQPLAKRRLQVQNAIDSMERSNLFRLLKGMSAEPQKGGKPESALGLAQYLHLRHKTEDNESHLHYYVGCALRDSLKYHQFPGLIGDGVETEEPLVEGQLSPKPDITVHTETDTYALEFHFTKQQITSSQVSTYALKNVIDKYMIGLPYLNSQLENLDS